MSKLIVAFWRNLTAIATCLLAFVPAAEAATCAADQWQPPPDTGGAGVQVLLKAIPLGTKWSELPITSKAELQKHSDNRLAAFRARWSAEALKQKAWILTDCPTPAMSAAIEDFYRKSYRSVGSSFSLSGIKNPVFKRALVGIYLGSIAALRANLTYSGRRLPNRDWDGESLFDSTRLPDRQTNSDVIAFNARMVAELRAVDDATLDDLEGALKQEVLFDARAHAVGAISGDSLGGRDLENACGLIALSNDIVQGYKVDNGRPRIFADDDAVLREANAIYLPSTQLKWLDVGTFAAAVSSTMLCRGTDDELEAFIGKPESHEIAKGIVQLRNWWVERLSVHPDARNKCSIYSAADRAEIWEAFSADQRSNNDGVTSMDTYKRQIDLYRDSKAERYLATARLAVQQVFPDEFELTRVQRLQVFAALDSDAAFANYPVRIAEALDVVQGTKDGPAASLWKAAIAKNVVYFQGNYQDRAPVRSEDEAAIRAMFDEVRAWVSARYNGYPIDVAALFDKFIFTVTTDSDSATSASTGNIRFGVGARRSRMEYYSLLLHEVRHALAAAWRAQASDPTTVIDDLGPTIEGAAVGVEDLLLETFMREQLKSDLVYALYALDYSSREARIVATTEATLGRYFRGSCSDSDDPDGLTYAKATVLSYGLPDAVATNQALRAHVGTQYLQYIVGARQMIDDVTWLQAEIDPSGKVHLDPFVFFACKLNNPRRDGAYVSALKACLKL